MLLSIAFYQLGGMQLYAVAIGLLMYESNPWVPIVGNLASNVDQRGGHLTSGGHLEKYPEIILFVTTGRPEY